MVLLDKTRGFPSSIARRAPWRYLFGLRHGQSMATHSLFLPHPQRVCTRSRFRLWASTRQHRERPPPQPPPPPSCIDQAHESKVFHLSWRSSFRSSSSFTEYPVPTCPAPPPSSAQWSSAATQRVSVTKSAQQGGEEGTTTTRSSGSIASKRGTHRIDLSAPEGRGEKKKKKEQNKKSAEIPTYADQAGNHELCIPYNT